MKISDAETAEMQTMVRNIVSRFYMAPPFKGRKPPTYGVVNLTQDEVERLDELANIK